ncbi:hypothetical protein CC78DRAFT_569920 [Lojkania enalia]|uniref:Uncharacterized protein n=1 Tax=Lojkania enalia TaxID=147567 RepID=A0A9P4KA18_9PLEO|nr:hypothetical protein CC78DRAFT_569920 [Didymosphaeria enalia]
MSRNSAFDTALVTYGGGGVGKVISQWLVQEGKKIIIADRTSPTSGQLRKQLACSHTSVQQDKSSGSFQEHESEEKAQRHESAGCGDETVFDISDNKKGKARALKRWRSLWMRLRENGRRATS